MDHNVVHTMINQIRADGVVPIHRERDLQFGSDTIYACHQDRLAHPGEIRREKSSKAAHLSKNLRPVSAFNARLNAALDQIAEINIYAGGCVGFCFFIRRSTPARA